ncbi:MAG: hypothetical protein A2X08_04415 [Bacteroidetes bacterium GWA2_32_17]|nr:MAG: hypothetical protein A2X08_04415 [Bacteroidetes bacterium GWA2_32_17]
MINYTKYCIIFFFLSIPLIIAVFWLNYSWLILLVFILLFITGLVIGSINIRSDFYFKTMCKGNNQTNSISLTFDDGPNQNITPIILNILKENGIKACFFCIGKNAEQNIELIKRIDSEGHIIGNHTYSHSNNFDLFSSSKMKNEITKTNYTIQNIINKEVKYFRPPYGVTNPNLSKALKKTNLISIGWSLRSLDTTAKGDITNTLKRLEKIKAGNIVLLHDNITEAPEILEKFITIVRAKNLKFMRLDELISIGLM